MSAASSPLDNIRVASPCRASWDAMTGDDQARLCQTCDKHVFNLSMMTRAEAEALIRKKEGTLCVRFARRADGTLVTDDCPVGLRVKRTKRGGFILALLAVLIPNPVTTLMKRASASALRTVPVLSAIEHTSAGEKVFAWLDSGEPDDNNVVMGAIALPPSPVPPSSGK